LNTLNPTTVLEELTDLSGDTLGGMYNLNLPATTFNQIGIYNIYIRPKQIKTKITDCGVLSVLPEIKGIVLDSTRSELSAISTLTEDNGLVGYRIEYFNSNTTKRRNFFRIITSSNKSEPVTENINNNSQKSVRYRFTDSGTLIFCTVTPSTSSQVKPNATPFIGEPNQDILITNTFFDPILLEVELVEHTLDTLAIGLYGEQMKEVETGIVTYYDEDRNIYKQYNTYEVRDEFSTLKYEVKEERSEIDETQDLDDVIEDL